MTRSSTALGQWPLWRWALLVNTLVVQAVTFVLRPTAIYRAIELDVPTHLLGALGATFALVPLLLAVTLGRACDRVGERRVMILGGLTMTACAVSFVFLGESVIGVVVATVLLGMGHLASVIGQQAMVANRTPAHRYDSAFGYYTFVASAGQALGPGLIILFGGAAAIPDTDTIFRWSVALGVLLVLSAVALPRHVGSRERELAATSSVRQLLARPGLVRALTVSCVVLAAVDITLVYLPVLGTERGISSGTVGLLLAVRAAASMTTRLFLGRLATRLGRGRLLTYSVLASAASVAVLPVDQPLPLLILVVVVAGLGLGAGQPLTMSWLAEATPPGLRGRAMSLRLTGNRLGQVLVPTTAGVLAAGAGASGVLWATAVGLGAAGLMSRHIPGGGPTRAGDDHS